MDDTNHKPATSPKLSNMFVGLVLLFYLVTSVLYQILWKVLQDTFTPKNSAFLNVAALFVCNSVALVILVFLRIKEWLHLHNDGIGKLFFWKYPKLLGEVGTPLLSMATRRYLVSCAKMAVSLAAGNVLWAVSGPFVAGISQSLLGLMTTPATLVLSLIFLKKNYSRSALVGVAIIGLGGFIGIVASPADVEDPTHRSALGATIMYSLAALPYAYAFIKGEELLHAGGNMWTLEVVAGWMETVLTMCITPYQSRLLEMEGQEPENFSFRAGWSCFVGQNLDCGTDFIGPFSVVSWVFLLFCTVTLASDLAYLSVTKFGSANTMVVCQVLALPCTNLAFGLPFLGRFQEPASLWNLLGCIIACFGIAIWVKEEHQPEEAAPAPPVSMDDVDVEISFSARPGDSEKTPLHHRHPALTGTPLSF